MNLTQAPPIFDFGFRIALSLEYRGEGENQCEHRTFNIERPNVERKTG